MKNEIRTKKIILGIGGFVLALLLMTSISDSNNSSELNFGERLKKWWNNLSGNTPETQPLAAVASQTTTNNLKNIVRLTTTGIFTIPAGTNWLNVINKGVTNNATIAFGSGSPSKLYIDIPTYIEKKNDTDSLPSAVVNGNGEEVLIEYSVNV